MLKNKPYKTCKVGEWVFDFYYQEGNIRRTYLKITSTSGIMSLFLGGNTHAFGYLLAAAKQGLDNQLAGYITTLFIPAMAMTQDQELTSGVQKAIVEWQKRKEAEGAEKAKAVTDSEEMASQVFVEDIVSEQGMSKKELKAKREADKAEMRAILNEDKE